MLVYISSHSDNTISTLRYNHVQLLVCAAMLFVLLLISPVTQADGLFDFQMKLAKMGNAVAEFKVGEMYETGFGVQKDQNEAQKWIKKAASHGHEAANFKLLYWDLKRSGLKPENKQKVTALRLKAEEENPQAMYYIGMMYAYGAGVEKNYDKSLDWLNKATFLGVLQAEREAVNVRRMKQSALNANRKAAEQRKAKEVAEAKKKAEKKKLKVAKEKKPASPKEKQKVASSKEKAAKEKSAEQKVKELAEALAKAKAEAAAQARAREKNKVLSLSEAEAKARAELNARIEAQAHADAEMDAYE